MKAREDELLPTQITLLEKMRDLGNDASWRRFFDTYWKLIYGVARASGLNDAESQDVVQNTLIAVAKHMPGFRYDPAHGSFKTWLLNMTRWRIIDHVRRRARQPEPLPSLADETATSTSIVNRIADPAGNELESIWEHEWQTNLLAAAMANVKKRIEPQNYQIFDFYVNKGWPPEKVAATFKVSVSHVYVTKTRVTEMLKQEVARIEEGDTPTPKLLDPNEVQPPKFQGPRVR